MITRICIILALLLSYGCSGQTPDGRLERIAAIVSDSPEEAIPALDSISRDSLSEADRHFHDLLTIKARDKAYITHTSDSLILDVIDYESQHRENGRLAEALYYGARVYSDLGDYPQALKFFQDALSIISEDETTDLKLKGCVLSQTGRLFNSLRLYDKAIPYLNETLKIDYLLMDSINLMYDHQLLGIINLHTERYTEAETNLKQSLSVASRLFPDNKRQKAQLNLYVAALKYYTGDIDSALILIKDVPENIHPASLNTALAYTAEIYSRAGFPDSAYHYAYKLIATDDPLNHKTGYEILLSDKLKPFVSQDSIVKYVYRYRQLMEEYLDKNEIEATAVRDAFFNYQFIEAEKNRAQAKERMIGFWLMISSIGILILAIFIIILKYRHKLDLLRLYDALDNIQRLKLRLETRHDSVNKNVDSHKDGRKDPQQNPISVKTLSENDMREKLRRELLIMYENNRDYIIPTAIVQSDAYRILYQHISENRLIDEDSKLWGLLENVILDCSPSFRNNLLLLTNGRLSLQDLRMAYLIKCGVSPSQMISLLGRTKGTISYRRESICFKVFDKKLGSKVIDSIIRSL